MKRTTEIRPRTKRGECPRCGKRGVGALKLAALAQRWVADCQYCGAGVVYSKDGLTRIHPVDYHGMVTDQRLGIECGGKCRWLVEPEPMAARITEIEIDADGDPWFTLEFAGDHKPVSVERNEIIAFNVDA